MGRISIRKVGPRRWEVRRRAFGFALGDSVIEYRTHLAAIRSLEGRVAGSAVLLAELAGREADAVSPIPPWTPLWDEPQGPDSDRISRR